MISIKHTPEYYATSDLDLFCRINGVNVHVSSMGRPISEAIMETLPAVYEQVSMIEMAEWRGRYGVWYNEELLRHWLHIDDTQKIARYLYTYVVMARKGFFSLAPISFDQSDEDLFLIAKPMNYDDRVIEGITCINEPNLNIQDMGAFTSVRISDLFNRER